VDFDKQSLSDVASLHTTGGETVIHFTDGQVVTLSHVDTLVFADKTEHV
jgi:hypothetical protein